MSVAPVQANEAGTPVLRSVSMYKHGVAAFRWTATVSKDGTLSLPIPARHLDDVLKSLVVLSADGSALRSIAYAADEPLQRQIGNWSIDLRQVEGLTDLLGRMVGSTVRLRQDNDAMTGQIIATEVVRRESVEQLIQDEWLLLLTDSGAIDRVDLKRVRGLEIVAGETADRLRAQLTLLRSSRQRDVVQLMIQGQPGQQLQLTYVAEAPVWKMSYRIVLGATPNDPLLLQGWAIAENTSAAEWTDVELSLLSGMPLSFTLDLSHPRFRTRPQAAIPEIETLAPPVAEAAIQEPRGGRRMAAQMARSADLSDTQEIFTAFSGAAGPPQPFARDSAFRMAAPPPPPPLTTRSVGDLFEYHIDRPVTIPAQQAALIPVLQTEAGGSAVSVYNQAVQAAYPLSAARLVNTTGNTLDGGPITVLKGDTYVGESMIDVLKPGEERLISYAVDLGCRAESQQQGGPTIWRDVRVSGGTMSISLVEGVTTIYRFSNVTDQERTVIVEHPIRKGWEQPTPAPAESTPSFHRYQVLVPGQDGAELDVQDRHIVAQHWSLLASGVDQIQVLLTRVGHDPGVARSLEPVIAAFRQVSARETRVAQLEREIATLSDDQARLRSNLQSLGQSSEERDLVRRYVAELAASEDRIRANRADLETATRALETARQELQTIVEGLEFGQTNRAGQP